VSRYAWRALKKKKTNILDTPHFSVKKKQDHVAFSLVFIEFTISRINGKGLARACCWYGCCRLILKTGENTTIPFYLHPKKGVCTVPLLAIAPLTRMYASLVPVTFRLLPRSMYSSKGLGLTESALGNDAAYENPLANFRLYTELNFFADWLFHTQVGGSGDPSRDYWLNLAQAAIIN